ncbi:hypothetical protein ABW20_dc0102190 [Dactylellina cionopaga]|nr:hypothetical protein ABW20_dc0102190 [Dactylellina cionopaga]
MPPPDIPRPSKAIHTAPPKRQNQQPAWTRDSKNNSSTTDLTDTLSFLNNKTGARPTRIRQDTEKRLSNIQISTLRDDGSSYRSFAGGPNIKPTRSRTFGERYEMADGQMRGAAPETSAQMLKRMTPVDEDHKDAVNGDVPETSLTNPAYAKLMRRLLDLANNGTATDVFSHAKNMASKGYAPTLESYSCLIQATIYHNLLKIFAHSPDYLSMEAILKEMQTVYWIMPDTEGAQHILQHYLATGQLERALEMFDSRREKGEKVHYNTYMEIIKALGRVGEVDEAMRVMFEFQKEWGSISGSGLQPMAWYELLNIAASNYHIDGVTYIWRKVVQTPSANPTSSRNTLNPDDGLCLKVLNTAARHGSPSLALDVFRIITQRNIRFQEHHFAALIGAYAKAGQLGPAFRALTLMRLQGVATTPTTANAIVEAITSGGTIESVDAAYSTLKDFSGSKNENEVVEIPGFNAVLAACVKLKDLERALGVYSECSSLNITPTTETFNTLFTGCVECSSPPNKELAMFLAGEMKEIGLQPDFITYEELLKVSLYQEDDYDDAFVYLEEMKEMVGGKVRPMVYEWIATRLHQKNDERLKMVVEEMISLGYTEHAKPWEDSLKVVAPGLVFRD